MGRFTEPRVVEIREEATDSMTSESSSPRTTSILLPSDETERMRRRVWSTSSRSVTISESPATVLAEVETLPSPRAALTELASKMERSEEDEVEVKRAGWRLVRFEVPGAGYTIVYVLFAFDVKVGGRDVHSFEQRYSVLRTTASETGTLSSFPSRNILRNMTTDELNVNLRHAQLAKWVQTVLSAPVASKALRSRHFLASLGLF
eukprot:Hpha_TRINITY_DN16153_c3_g1::TRINITY_DN16153_c3_g1_i1::g.4286::m.4286